MLQMKPFDPSCPIDRQLDVSQSPIIPVNTFAVDPAGVARLLSAWEADANWMKQQPGFISTQLHRGIGESAMFLNYAVWESVEHFRRAFSHPDFRARLAAYPESTVASPHLFARMSVPNLCAA
ncbi:MAG TPA: antibiotic biosynthesis monooxygenase family protein [Pseudolabrys sp.]